MVGILKAPSIQSSDSCRMSQGELENSFNSPFAGRLKDHAPLGSSSMFITLFHTSQVLLKMILSKVSTKIAISAKPEGSSANHI